MHTNCNSFLIKISLTYSSMASAEKGGVLYGLCNKRIERLYNHILRQIRIIFAKQLEMNDLHSTLLELEREDFVKDVHLLKLFIENEKCKVKKVTNCSVPPNSDENNASEYSDSDCDESCWFDEDDDYMSLVSGECSGVEKMEKVEKGLVDTNREEVDQNFVEKEICAGIGKKDF